MPAGNQTQAFGYPLHDNEQRGSPVDLDGVPQIPQLAHDWMTHYGECGLRGALEPLCDEAIEAACWVILNRRLSLRAKQERVPVPRCRGRHELHCDEEDEW